MPSVSAWLPRDFHAEIICETGVSTRSRALQDLKLSPSGNLPLWPLDKRQRARHLQKVGQRAFKHLQRNCTWIKCRYVCAKSAKTPLGQWWPGKENKCSIKCGGDLKVVRLNPADIRDALQQVSKKDSQQIWSLLFPSAQNDIHQSHVIPTLKLCVSGFHDISLRE